MRVGWVLVWVDWRRAVVVAGWIGVGGVHAGSRLSWGLAKAADGRVTVDTHHPGEMYP